MVVLDGGHDYILASCEGGTLTNDSNIVGAGHVGNGNEDLWLVNENHGTIDAHSCEQTLTLNTGCNQLPILAHLLPTMAASSTSRARSITRAA